MALEMEPIRDELEALKEQYEKDALSKPEEYGQPLRKLDAIEVTLKENVGNSKSKS